VAQYNVNAKLWGRALVQVGPSLVCIIWSCEPRDDFSLWAEHWPYVRLLFNSDRNPGSIFDLFDVMYRGRVHYQRSYLIATHVLREVDLQKLIPH